MQNKTKANDLVHDLIDAHRDLLTSQRDYTSATDHIKYCATRHQDLYGQVVNLVEFALNTKEHIDRQYKYAMKDEDDGIF